MERGDSGSASGALIADVRGRGNARLPAKLTPRLAVALLALAVVQVVFGTAVPFLNVDVVGNLTKVIAALGSSGLVGLIAVAVLYAVLNKKA